MKNFIDSDTLIYRASFKETLDEAIVYLNQMIKDILDVTNTSSYLLFVTKGKQNFRYWLYDEYKANRENIERPVLFDTLKQYAIDELKAIYNLDKEADDLCSLHAAYYNKFNEDVIISSSDGDFKTLGYNIYNYHYKHQNFERSVSPLKCLYANVLTGKKKDNIPGLCKGLGEINADIWLDLNYSSKSYSEAVLEAYTKGMDSKLFKRFKGFKPDWNEEFGIQLYERNLKLNTLLTRIDECINLDVSYNIYPMKKLNF
jgi:hypothetical protein